jgi:hypothetical protein
VVVSLTVEAGSLISEAGDFEAGNKGRQMGIKMTGKNREKSWCGWFHHNKGILPP